MAPTSRSRCSGPAPRRPSRSTSTSCAPTRAPSCRCAHYSLLTTDILTNATRYLLRTAYCSLLAHRHAAHRAAAQRPARPRLRHRRLRRPHLRRDRLRGRGRQRGALLKALQPAAQRDRPLHLPPPLDLQGAHHGVLTLTLSLSLSLSLTLVPSLTLAPTLTLTFTPRC
eukprot:scaffold61083_cov52-Phaeocystis_antarctica.AAC.1